MNAQLRLKHSFSRQHFHTARYFAKRSLEIENETEHAMVDETIKSIYRSYITGAIIASVAGLESSINELFLEAIDKNKNALQGLDDADLNLLAEWWKEVERVPVLLKYQMALMFTKHYIFDRGTQPYQDVNSLIRLRNALVHYKPDWETEMQVHENLRSRLDSKFALNPFALNNSLWFPHVCLGSGCSLWSITTSEAFINAFCEEMGIPNRV